VILDNTSLLRAVHSLRRDISSCTSRFLNRRVYTRNIIFNIIWLSFTYIFKKRMHLLCRLHRREDCPQNSPHWRIQGVINPAPNTLFAFHLCNNTGNKKYDTLAKMHAILRILLIYNTFNKTIHSTSEECENTYKHSNTE